MHTSFFLQRMTFFRFKTTRGPNGIFASRLPCTCDAWLQVPFLPSSSQISSHLSYFVLSDLWTLTLNQSISLNCVILRASSRTMPVTTNSPQHGPLYAFALNFSLLISTVSSSKLSVQRMWHVFVLKTVSGVCIISKRCIPTLLSHTQCNPCNI